MKYFAGSKTLFKLGIVLAISSTATIAAALSYNTKTVMIFTYQNSSGYWFGGGPVQFVWAGSENEEEVKDLVSHDRHGNFRYLGKHGKCSIYQSNVEIRSYDNSPEKLAKEMHKRC